MIAGSDDGSVAGKSAKAGKDGKNTKETKDSKKLREDPVAADKTAPLLRQVATDLAVVSQNLARLQADVDALKRDNKTPAAAAAAAPTRRRGAGAGQAEPILAALNADTQAVTAVAIKPSDGGGSFVRVADAEQIRGVDTARLARMSYAFSSAPKISLLRLLLDEGEQSAAQLGEKAGLTTGSLYHHLRELVHSGVAHQSRRNKYALTDLGRHTLMALLTLMTD